MPDSEKTIVYPKLHHINLKTTRLQEMVDWYGKVVGGEVVFQFPGGAWLTNDEANHRIAFLSSPQMSDDPEKIFHTGMHHSAFEYDSIGDLLAAYSRLKDEGIEPHATLDHGMTTSFYYADPDGNSVELQYDNFDDWEKSKEWMKTSSQMVANPIGVPVDPEKMIEARKAGTSVEEIHERAYAGEWPTEFDPRVPL
jgi:catechol-2,3-dioxygenase